MDREHHRACGVDEQQRAFHVDAKSFICPTCFASFLTKNKLMEHKISHSDVEQENNWHDKATNKDS